jgi:AcrR family transcriptional regulator
MAGNKREETKQRLVDAAFALFEAHGYDQVTVDQIAAAAGVSRRTFFRHFKSKERVVFPFTDLRLDLFREAIRAMAKNVPPTLDDLQAVYGFVAQNWIENKERMLRSRRIVSQSSVLLTYDQLVNVKWERAIGLELDGSAIESTPPGEPDPVPTLRSRIIAGMLVGTMRPVFERWYECEGRFDLIAAGNRALELAIEGLKALEGDKLDLTDIDAPGPRISSDRLSLNVSE